MYLEAAASRAVAGAYAALSPRTPLTGLARFYVGTNPDGTAGGADGNYFWLVHYNDANLTDPNDRCESSNVTITDG